MYIMLYLIKGDTVMADFKTIMQKIKKNYNNPVKPVIAWSAFGGAVALAVILALIFWL